jgi:hypothetical protein
MAAPSGGDVRPGDGLGVGSQAACDAGPRVGHCPGRCWPVVGRSGCVVLGPGRGDGMGFVGAGLGIRPRRRGPSERRREQRFHDPWGGSSERRPAERLGFVFSSLPPEPSDSGCDHLGSHRFASARRVGRRDDLAPDPNHGAPTGSRSPKTVGVADTREAFRVVVRDRDEKVWLFACPRRTEVRGQIRSFLGRAE